MMNIDQVRSRLRFVAQESRLEAANHDGSDRIRLIRNSAQLSHAATMRQLPQEELEVLLEAGIDALVKFIMGRVPQEVPRG